MLKIRVFPTLLLNGIGAVKTIRFRNPIYIGDPMNAARIFSAKGADELALLDIMATVENRLIKTEIVSHISDECMMPLTAGGGVKTLEDIRKLLNAGAEKVAINSQAIIHPEFVARSADTFGSSTIVISIDAKRVGGGYQVFTHHGTQPAGVDPVSLAVKMEELGAGEILINSIDQDGMREGFDIELVQQVADAVKIPVIACGGAGKLEDIGRVVKEGHVSAVTAGSLFVFQGRRRAVLINFPTREELNEVLA